MKNEVRTTLLLLGDVATLLASFIIMLELAFWGRLTSAIVHLHFLPFTILGILWLLIFFIFNLYDPEKAKPTIPHLQQIVLAFIVAMTVSVLFFYAIPFFNITPKTNLVIFGGVCAVLFILWRRIFYNIFSAYFHTSIVFIADDEQNNNHIKDLTTYISSYPQSGFQLMGKYNSIEEYFASHKTNPQVFIIAKEIWKNSANFKKLYDEKIMVLDLAQAYEDILGRVPVEAIDEGWFIHNMRQNSKSLYESVQNLFNMLVALIVLAVTSPFLLITSLLIKLNDSGPVFYSQIRVGKNGKNFKLYKFRSMSVDAEKEGPQWSDHGDTRITPVGKIIRKLHLDEIPQLWNVLRGDIALIGPRPERPEFVEKLEKEIPFYYLRHMTAPGFTGWAQIKFRYARSVMDSKEKFEYDLYYLKNKNIFIDLGILARTIQIIFKH